MEGYIVFSTKKKKPTRIFDYNYLLGNLIARVTRLKGQDLDDVKVHAAIVYKEMGVNMVRSMGTGGDEHYVYNNYIHMYRDRVELVKLPIEIDETLLPEFNKSCRTLKVKYDYSNLLFMQGLKYIFKKIRFKETYYNRICSEDTVRQLNLLGLGIKNPEKISPNQLYKILKNEY